MIETNFAYAANGKYKEYAGLSTDTKPTGSSTEKIGTGSIFIEVDTGNVFFFNEAAEEWVEQFSFQQDSGGAKSAPILKKSAPVEEQEAPAEEQEEEPTEEPEEAPEER